MKNQNRSSQNTINLSNLLIEKIISLVPALIAVYDIKTGQYVYVNDAVTRLLGYKKEDFLKKGLSFTHSLVHSDDLPKIASKNLAILKEANKKNADLSQDHQPVSFEYRMRHKKGHWIWLHSDGVIFARDKKNKVEYVMNVSVDITKNKEQEAKEKQERDKAEAEKNLYLNSIITREKVSEVLRIENDVNSLVHKSLTTIIERLPATFARLWCMNEEEKVLELFSSAGKFPPTKTIRSKLKIGEYAAGIVAKKNKPFITNNIYKEKNFQIQNNKWAKRHKLKSFAGYPLFFKNKLIGVLALYATYDLTERTLTNISHIVDMLAQELTRRNVESQLKENQERYQSFITQSSEGIWRFELEEPVRTNLPVKKQINHFYQYAYLAECNDAMAKMYGFKKASDIAGSRLSDMLIRDNPSNVAYLKSFIASNYNLSGAESTEIDKSGNIKYFQNNMIGIVENGMLIRAWGIQRDITDRKIAENELQKLSAQKDEFIAIASHELKTPVTSLKAYTQILQNRLQKLQNPESVDFLQKMDAQINKLTTLIADLLDVSKIEAGKLQFQIERFDLHQLINETSEEMQRTTNKKINNQISSSPFFITGDRDRIGQVLINFISNAIKYSPNSDKLIVKSEVKNNNVTVSVQDFGLGISKNEQLRVFDRFFRASNPNRESYPGLGLGLYISEEIIKRHNGTIGVKSQKGKGSTFFFTLPSN